MFPQGCSEGGTPKQNHFNQHALREDHHGLLEDCKIFIDKNDTSNPTRRKFFWMYKLNKFFTSGTK